MGTAVMKALSARRTSPLPSVKSWTLMFSRNGAAPGVELLYEFTPTPAGGWQKATDHAEALEARNSWKKVASACEGGEEGGMPRLGG